MNSHRNDVCNLLVNTYAHIKIYREFFHGIIYIANEGRHVRIWNNCIPFYLYCSKVYIYNVDLLFLNLFSSWNRTNLKINNNQWIILFSEIEDERFSLYPTSFTQTITRDTSIRLTVTYKCINMPVYFTWFAVGSV